MLRGIASLMLLCCAGQASAQSCPDFFRFVDFGLEGRDGVIYRGGPVFRGEGFSGASLLLRDQTQCREVREISKDGHGNPIPVVKSINYDPVKTGIELAELRVGRVDDTQADAEENARAHRLRLDQAGTMITQGETFLCASSEGARSLSCQLASPYPGNIALVVYCDAVKCTAPVMAIDEHLFVRAVWENTDAVLSDPNTAGSAFFDKVQEIHDFLEPLSSGL